MNLMDLARRPVVTLSVTDHCRRAAELMTQFHVRHLPVVDEGVPVGMVSDRDLLANIGWWNSDAHHANAAIADCAERLPVDEVMSSPLLWVAPEDAPEKAARLMLDNQVHALPLLDSNQIVGIVSETDFLRCFNGQRNWQRRTVAEHMTARVFCVSRKEPIRSAWRLMRDKHIHHLLVCEGDQPQGILSDRDLLAGISWDACGPEGIQDRVECIMTVAVAAISPDSTLTDAALAMMADKIGALPVYDQTALIGIITESDLLRAFLASTAN